jgi:large subunit ribosomal protein L22
MELVLDLIRGKSYDEAAAILKNVNKSGSPVVLKVLESAAANAENNLSLIKDSLYVAECYAMAGPTLKRMMPRARGRADRILKRTCHVRVILDAREEKVTPKKTVKKAEVTKKVTTTKKEIPAEAAEKPIADKPNTQKPLGEKKVSAAKQPTKAEKPASPAKKPAGEAAAKPAADKKPAAKKPAVKKEAK